MYMDTLHKGDTDDDDHDGNNNNNNNNNNVFIVRILRSTSIHCMAGCTVS
jgi:hypothetical protein